MAIKCLTFPSLISHYQVKHLYSYTYCLIPVSFGWDGISHHITHQQYSLTILPVPFNEFSVFRYLENCLIKMQTKALAVN